MLPDLEGRPSKASRVWKSKSGFEQNRIVLSAGAVGELRVEESQELLRKMTTGRQERKSCGNLLAWALLVPVRAVEPPSSTPADAASSSNGMEAGQLLMRWSKSGRKTEFLSALRTEFRQHERQYAHVLSCLSESALMHQADDVPFLVTTLGLQVDDRCCCNLPLIEGLAGSAELQRMASKVSNMLLTGSMLPREPLLALAHGEEDEAARDVADIMEFGLAPLGAGLCSVPSGDAAAGGSSGPSADAEALLNLSQGHGGVEEAQFKPSEGEQARTPCSWDRGKAWTD